MRNDSLCLQAPSEMNLQLSPSFFTLWLLCFSLVLSTIVPALNTTMKGEAACVEQYGLPVMCPSDWQAEAGQRCARLLSETAGPLSARFPQWGHKTLKVLQGCFGSPDFLSLEWYIRRASVGKPLRPHWRKSGKLAEFDSIPTGKINTARSRCAQWVALLCLCEFECHCWCLARWVPVTVISHFPNRQSFPLFVLQFGTVEETDESTREICTLCEIVFANLCCSHKYVWLPATIPSFSKLGGWLHSFGSFFKSTQIALKDPKVILFCRSSPQRLSCHLQRFSICHGFEIPPLKRGCGYLCMFSGNRILELQPR